MPTDQAEAIVLRTSPIGDQDKLAAFFCREKGVLRGVAKGARKFGNRFGSSLEPMSYVRVFYYEKERRDLITVSGCDLIESFFEVQAEPATAFLLTYFAELVEEFAPVRACEDVLFRLLLSVLRCLKGGGDREFAGAYFEAWFLQANGLLPDLAACRRCRKSLAAGGWLAPKKDGAYCPDCAPLQKDPLPPGMQDVLRWIRKNPPQTGACAAPFAAEVTAAVRRALQALVVYHMEREPRSLHFLKTK